MVPVHSVPAKVKMHVPLHFILFERLVDLEQAMASPAGCPANIVVLFVVLAMAQCQLM